MSKFKKLFSLLASLALSSVVAPALSQTAAVTPAATAAATPAPPTVTVDGLVDAGFTYNFTNSSKGVNGSTSPGVFFNNIDDTYSVNLAEADIKVVQGNASGYLALVGGSSNTGLALNPGVDILQAYVAYNADAWTFTGGRFATWMGNEVIESSNNWNYSRSLLFWYTIPLWHTGLSIKYAPSSQFAITGYATDGWNNAPSAAFYDDGKTYGLQVSIVPDSTWSFLLNGIIGSNTGFYTGLDQGDTHYVGELIATYTATDKLTLALDAEYGGINPLPIDVLASGSTETFWGADLYAKYQIASDWALALRLEELESSNDWLYDGGAGTAGVPYIETREATLTISHNLTTNLLLRLEGRYDMAYTGGTMDDPTSATSVPGPYAAGSGSQFTTSASAAFSF